MDISGESKMEISKELKEFMVEFLESQSPGDLIEMIIDDLTPETKKKWDDMLEEYKEMTGE
jgi:hypothetical protein